MLFDPTERNVDPFLFPTRIRTMKKLVLTSAIHDKDVTMAKPAQVTFIAWTGPTPPSEDGGATKTHRNDEFGITVLSKQRFVVVVVVLFIQTGWDVRARRRYSFRATLNMDGTALLLRCNNGRYKNEGYEPNGCVHGTSEHWRHERMVSNCAPAWKMMLLPTCGRNTTSKKGGT